MASAGVASSPGGQLIRIITTALLWWVVCYILVVHACVQMHLAAQRDKISACALCCGLYFVHLPVILIVLSKSLCVVAISRRFWHPRQVVTGCFCLSFQVSKAAWQEKRFQDYNERCTFHHRARVRPPFFFPSRYWHCCLSPDEQDGLLRPNAFHLKLGNSSQPAFLCQVCCGDWTPNVWCSLAQTDAVVGSNGKENFRLSST